MNSTFKETDPEGLQTLEVISAADKFNLWMFETIRTYCSGNVLEIGSGIGNISQFFLNAHYRITLSDIRKSYCEKLLTDYSPYKNLSGVICMDLVDPAFEDKYHIQFGTYDTIFSLNVVEHIKDHHLAISNAGKLLKENGVIITLVPAYQFLYNGFDEALEHFRRYDKNSLELLMKEAGLYPLKTFYFNFAGILGWYVSGKLQKNKVIPSSQMKLYNTLVPVFKAVDLLIGNRMGLSVINVSKKA